MSPKELLYIEDALSHEKEMNDLCAGLAPQIADPDLKAFVQGLEAKCGANYSKLYGVLSSAASL